MAASDLLTDKTIRAALKAAAADDKPRKISDGAGLVLDVRPNGAGWWRLRYWLAHHYTVRRSSPKPKRPK